MELISSLIRMISIAEFSGDGAEEKAEAMKPCEYKDGHGNLCGKPTNLSVTLAGRIIYCCPEHKLLVAEQATGRQFRDPPKPKA